MVRSAIIEMALTAKACTDIGTNTGTATAAALLSATVIIFTMDFFMKIRGGWFRYKLKPMQRFLNNN